QGRFWSFENVHLNPRPVQRPHPPIWVAAVLSEESFIAAGKNGHHLMIVPFAGSLERNAALLKLYRDAWDAAGGVPGAGQVQVSLHACLAETHQQAMDAFERPINRYIEV